MISIHIKELLESLMIQFLALNKNSQLWWQFARYQFLKLLCINFHDIWCRCFINVSCCQQLHVNCTLDIFLLETWYEHYFLPNWFALFTKFAIMSLRQMSGLLKHLHLVKMSVRFRVGITSTCSDSCSCCFVYLFIHSFINLQLQRTSICFGYETSFWNQKG